MKMTEQEIWRPVKDYEGLYEVSNFGRVRSLTRKVKTSKGITQTWIGQMLTPGKSGNGYYYVTLSKNGKSKARIYWLLKHSYQIKKIINKLIISMGTRVIMLFLILSGAHLIKI